MKKNDIILILVLLVLAGLSYLGFTIYQQKTTGQNEMVVIYIDGKKDSSFPLNTDMELKIKIDDSHYNLLVIKDGYADVTEASCPDGICVKHRKISKNGQTIVCLPNRLVIQIENGEAADVDGES